MVASSKDFRTPHRPMRGILYGVLLGALLWSALIGILMAV